MSRCVNAVLISFLNKDLIGLQLNNEHVSTDK